MAGVAWSHGPGATDVKIAYVTMQFPAPSETFASSDVRALVERGDAVTVFALRPAHADHDAFVRDRSLGAVDIRPLTSRRVVQGLRTLVRHPAWTLSLLGWLLRWTGRRPRHLASSLALLPGALAAFEEIERESFDVVHLFWGHYPSMVAHLAEGFAPRIVRSVFLGAYDLVMAYGGSAPVARSAHAVWTHARVNVPAIAQLGVPEGRVRVAYRGVDVARLTSIRATTEGERVPHRIVTVARLIASKGMRDVIQAFVAVRERVPDATLCIVGDGPDRHDLERVARASGVGHAIEFLGHVPHDEALRAMGRSDVFVLLSSKPDERLPNAAKEAMALGCVCVVTATPGIEELVAHEATGFVVDSVAAPSVARWLERALTLGGARATLTAAAAAHVRSSFDAAATMATYRAAWAELAAAPEPRADRG